MTDSRKITSKTILPFSTVRGQLRIPYRTKRHISLTFLLMVLGLFFYGLPGTPAYGDDFRSEALHRVNLLLWQSGGQLTHFSLTENPAALFDDWHRNRVEIATVYQSDTGDLHRLYDPSGQDNLHLSVNSWQDISPHQVLYGGIHYRWLRLHRVAYALEPAPYDDDPQVIADTTVGDFRYQGPQIHAAYAVRFAPRFSLGIGLQYALSKGAKRRYSFAQILHRQVIPTLGMTFRITPAVQLGALVEWHDVKDRIELTRDVLTGEDVLVRFYRREAVYQQHVGDLIHERDWRAPRVLLSLFHQTPSGQVTQAGSVSYRSPRQQLSNRSTVLNRDSDWFASEWQMRYELRWRDSRNRWRAGLRLGAEYLSSFSRHPEQELLITERTRWRGQLETAIGLHGFPGKTGQLLVQAGIFPLHDRYHDYPSHLDSEMKGPVQRLSVMMETSWMRSYRLILGGTVQRQRFSGYSSYYLPDYREWELTAGVQRRGTTYQSGVLLEYFHRQAREENTTHQGMWIRLFLSHGGDGE